MKKRFVIYEYADGASESVNLNSKPEVIKLEAEKGITLTGTFYYSDEIEPAVILEIEINPKTILGLSDYEISEQLQRVLHFGFSCTGKIIPRSDRDRYVYDRHGEQITRWIIEQVRGKPPIGFRCR